MSRKTARMLAQVCTFALAFALLTRAYGSPPQTAPLGDPAKEIAPSLKKFIDILSTVQAESSDQPPLDKLIYEGAIPSMLRQLDPHTQFFDPVQFQQLQQMEQSEQKGFGSVVSVLPGQVIFLQTLPGLHPIKPAFSLVTNWLRSTTSLSIR